MRLKDGFQICGRCGGQGCYWCRRQGWRAQCPRCGNSEPELLTKDEETDELGCLACNAQFEKTGELIPVLQRPVRLPPSKPS